MDTAQARRLIELNSTFYRENADSFAQTRRSAWPGWATCLERVGNLSHGQGRPYRVLDVACGNLRFEAYLQRELPLQPFEFHAVDNCDSLQREAHSCGVSASSALRFQPLDVLGVLAGAWEACAGNALDAAAGLAQSMQAPPCDLSVSFGFMHHVPRAPWRAALLRALLAKTAPGGYACVSFWQFMKSDGLAQKAEKTTAAACQALALSGSALEEGDYLLGWNDKPGAYRYCHHFTDAEIDELAAGVVDAAKVVARFSADGRTGNLNSYVVLQRRL